MLARRIQWLVTLACAIALPILAAVFPAISRAEENGRLPQSSLARIAYPEGTAYLHAGSVAAAWNTMNQCAARDGVRLLPQVSSYSPAATAYRSFDVQVALFHQFGFPRAAYPGTSNHGWGHAVDLRDWSMRLWTDAHGGAFGFEKRTSDAQGEWWHLAAAGVALTWSAPDPGPSYEFPVLRPGSRGICISLRVEEAQKLLGIPKTGHYGRHMAQAVLRFKAAHGLRHDTTISERTWRALRAPAPVASEAVTDRSRDRQAKPIVVAESTCPRFTIEGAHPDVCNPNVPARKFVRDRRAPSLQLADAVTTQLRTGQRGADLSNNDPASRAELFAMRRAGLTFIWLKRIEGLGFTDVTAPGMAVNARDAGLEVGYYDFGHICLVSARAEADRMADQLRGLPMTLKVILDAEFGGSGCSVRQWVLDWIDEMHRRGYSHLGIYTGNWWWAPEVGCWWPRDADGQLLAAWISGYPHADVPCGAGGITVHQDTDRYRIPGVGFAFDGNVLLGTPDQILQEEPVPPQIAYDCARVDKYRGPGRHNAGTYGAWQLAIHRRNSRNQGWGCVPSPHRIAHADHLPEVAPLLVFKRCAKLDADLHGAPHRAGEVHRLRAYIASQGWLCNGGSAHR